MFGIGFSEIVLIFLVIIIFVRPDDLPSFLRNAGRFYGKAKKLYNEIIQVKDRIIKEIDEADTFEDPKDAPKTSPEVSAESKVLGIKIKEEAKVLPESSAAAETKETPVQPSQPEPKEGLPLTAPPKE